MPRLSPEHISDFVRSLMPEHATEQELREAQSHVDDYLDVIDRLHARLVFEDEEIADRDNSAPFAMVNRPHHTL